MKNRLLLLIIISIISIVLVGCESNNEVEQEINGDTLLELIDKNEVDESIDLFDKTEYALLNPNRDFSNYDTYSSYFNEMARVGTANNPIKIGQVGLLTSVCQGYFNSGEYVYGDNQYGYNFFVKINRRLNNEELIKYSKDIKDFQDAKIQGVLCEIDYNNQPLLLKGIKEGLDNRDTIQPITTAVEDYNCFNKHESMWDNYIINDDLPVFVPYSANDFEDNRVCIIWTVKNNADNDGILRLSGFVGDPLRPDDFFYSYFEF